MATNIGWKRRILFAIAGATFLIAGLTLPGLAAPKKTMTFQVNTTGPTTEDFSGEVNTAPGATSSVFWIRATNTTPGTGNPASLQVRVPSTPSGFVITDATIENNANSSKTGNNTPPVFDSSGTFVDFNNIQPLQNNQFITVRIVATTPPASCPNSVQSTDWTGALWQGSTVGNALPFETKVSSGTVTTLSAASCPTLEFVTAPQDAAKNTRITGTDFNPDVGEPNVQVALKVNGIISTAFDGSTVTITEDGPRGSIKLGTGSAVLDAGLADFPDLQIVPDPQIDPVPDPAGDYNLTATVTNGPSTAPVLIKITPAGVCPGGVSGQVDFTTPEFNEPGDGTLNIGDLTSTDCTGLDIRFTTPDGTVQQWSILLSKPDVTAKITGYTTWTWDLPGTEPVPWTQVSWKVNVNNGPPLVSTEFVDLPRCNAEAVNLDDMPDPAADNLDYLALFPLVDAPPFPEQIIAGLCMFNSTLQAFHNDETDLDTYLEVQRIAINEDPAGRKG